MKSLIAVFMFLLSSAAMAESAMLAGARGYVSACMADGGSALIELGYGKSETLQQWALRRGCGENLRSYLSGFLYLPPEDVERFVAVEIRKQAELLIRYSRVLPKGDAK